jgi:hypothetical protein
MDRRAFLSSLPLAPLILCAFRQATLREQVVRAVSAHEAPFYVEQLTPGLTLSLRRERGRTWAMFSGHRIGWLPDSDTRAECRIARVSRDERGRLRISVNL